MNRVTSALCWLIVAAGLAPLLAQRSDDGGLRLQGSWTAIRAERDGKIIDDVVGHQLSFDGGRFQIQTKDGKSLYAGTVRVNPSAQPAAIDFEHTEGTDKGRTWKGIYALDGDRLTICDNAPTMEKGRPSSFDAKAGSGYFLITFVRVSG